MENKIQNNDEQDRINAEILSHMSNPKNYGELENSNGIGKCVNARTGEFLVVYIKVNTQELLEDISYGCQANQDSSLAASIFTEMIKGDTLQNALSSLQLMESHLLNVSESQKTKSGMVLHAFRAAMINRENLQNSKFEEIFTINIEEE